MNLNEQKMVFILGRGRSGTTLISNVLNESQDICIAPEGLFLMNLYKKYRYKSFDSDTINEFCKDVYLEPKMNNWSFNNLELKEFMHKNLSLNTSFDKVVKAVYSANAYYLGKKNVKYLGDKNPHYALFTKEILAVFPDALFIHLIRDPRANISSYKEVSFDYNDSGILAYRWKIYNNEISKTYFDRGNYFIIKYENLVIKPQETVDLITKNLNVNNFVAKVNSSNIKLFEHSKKWHKKLNDNFDTSRLEAWRNLLNNEEVEQIESICKDLIIKYEYQGANLLNSKRYTFLNLVSEGTIFLEKFLFNFPLLFRTKIISAYRKMTSKKNKE